ncbi:hypothetical protein MKZ38_002605 [Zalerion maritima]|uniref:Uncharacterized protein n=1 Tax=Zalerion maritima TaxID=339359 RepID=A0AAD5WSX0_9PEZI|nr:hypothetical protein MKZ38_002605 [Zalerion maritima]
MISPSDHSPPASNLPATNALDSPRTEPILAIVFGITGTALAIIACVFVYLQLRQGRRSQAPGSRDLEATDPLLSPKDLRLELSSFDMGVYRAMQMLLSPTASPSPSSSSHSSSANAKVLYQRRTTDIMHVRLFHSGKK